MQGFLALFHSFATWRQEFETELMDASRCRVEKAMQTLNEWFGYLVS